MGAFSFKADFQQNVWPEARDRFNFNYIKDGSVYLAFIGLSKKVVCL